MGTVKVTCRAVADLCEKALVAAGCIKENARPVAEAIAWAEATGNRVCGLFYLPVFIEQLDAGILLGDVAPTLRQQASSALLVDAKGGFAHPAIALGLPALIGAARSTGVAGLGVRNSYNCLSLAHHVIPLAEQGLLGLCTSNAAASVAPPSATKPLFGTNPFAFAVPGRNGPRLVIDQSTSAATFTALLKAAEIGEAVPLGWAQDAEGNPTTDAEAGLGGSLLTFGGQKGANVALIVEILSAVLTASSLSTEAGQFSGQTEKPSLVGQYLLAIDPARFAGEHFHDKLDELCATLEANGVRLPGTTRLRVAPDSLIELPAKEWENAEKLAGQGTSHTQ